MPRRKSYYCAKVNPVLIILMVLLLSGLIIFSIKIGPVIQNTAAVQARTMAGKTINEAIGLALQQNTMQYDDLAVVSRDSNGDITSVQTDMAQINAIANQITASVIQEIETLSLQSVKLPLGTLIGSRLFSGKGPEITFHVVPTGAVESNIHNKFESAGINQTLHQILLEIDVGIYGLLPGYSIYTTVSNQICLAETIIIGTVPDYYTLIEGTEDDLTGLVADYGPGKNGIS